MTNKKNIAHVFSTLNVGGMEKVGSDLILHLDPEKYSNIVICLQEKGKFSEALMEAGVEVINMHSMEMSKLGLLWSLYKLFKTKQIDIVHTNNPAPHIWAGTAAFLAFIPIRVHTKHGKNFVNIKRRVFFNGFFSKLSTKIVAVSEDIEKQAITIEKVSPKKVMTIHNGVDISYFARPKYNSLETVDLPIKDSDFVIGAISRFSRDKDYATLIKAFSHIVNQETRLKLLLVGDGETLGQMRELAIQLNIEENVIFTGYRTDVKALLSLLDIYVLSTHTEGISIALLEAMAMNLPVVATAVGGNVEIIQDKENGLLVAHEDEKALMEILSTLIVDNQLRKELANQARKRVEQAFSINAMVNKYEALYQG